MILSITFYFNRRPFAFTSVGAAGRADSQAMRKRIRSEIEREASRFGTTMVHDRFDPAPLVRKATDFAILKLRSGRGGEATYATDGYGVTGLRHGPTQHDGLVMHVEAAA